MVDFTPEDIEWTETRYSLSTLKENSDLTLPAIIKITSGYFGISDLETFSSDEVLFLYDWKMEERVMAVSKNITLSIPICSKDFFKVNSPQSPVMTLAQIVQTYPPPITVRVIDTAGKDCPMVVNNEQVNLGLLTLKSSHYLEYVLANTTVAGQVCTCHLIWLPIYRKVRFVMARKLGGVPIESLTEQINGFLFLSRNIKRDIKIGNRPDIVEQKLGVVDYHELLDILDDYDYMRTVPMGNWSGRAVRNPGQLPRSVSNPETQLHTAMAERQRSSSGNLPKSNHYAIIADGASNNYEIIDDGYTQPFHPQLMRDLNQFHINATDRAVSPTFVNSQPITNRLVATATGVMPIAQLGGCNNSGSGLAGRLVPKISSSSPDLKSPPLPPRCPRILSTGSMISPVPISEALPFAKQFLRAVPTPKAIIQTPPKAIVPTPKEFSPTSNASAPTQKAKNLAGPRSNIPVATLLPVLQHTTAQELKKTPCSPTSPIHDKTDIPKDIVDLSVTQLSQCLIILNMAEFIPKFREVQMDGMLLCSSSVEDLVAEFGMGMLKAKKLKMFANNGWRPGE